MCQRSSAIFCATGARVRGLTDQACDGQFRQKGASRNFICLCTNVHILNFKQYFKLCEKQRDTTAKNFQVGFLLAQFGAFYTFRIKGDLMVFSNYRNWIEFKTVWICYRNFRRNVKTQMLSKYTKKARFRHYLFQKLLYTKGFKEVDKLLRNFFLLEC